MPILTSCLNLSNDMRLTVNSLVFVCGESGSRNLVSPKMVAKYAKRISGFIQIPRNESIEKKM